MSQGRAAIESLKSQSKGALETRFRGFAACCSPDASPVGASRVVFLKYVPKKKAQAHPCCFLFTN